MDKILTEAFDKLKAIEESEDPFCIGAKEETVTEMYSEVNEIEDDPSSGFAHDSNEESLEQHKDNYNKGLKYDEAPDARVEPKVYQIDTNHGDNYAIHFSTDGGKERAFVEVNGITVATYDVGGAGAMNARIQDPAEVLNALTHALHAANGSEGT